MIRYVSIIYSVYVPAPSNGWCSNPKGLQNGTPYHPFGTPWRVQVYIIDVISRKYIVPCHVHAIKRSNIQKRMLMVFVWNRVVWRVAQPWFRCFPVFLEELLSLFATCVFQFVPQTLCLAIVSSSLALSSTTVQKVSSTVLFKYVSQ